MLISLLRLGLAGALWMWAGCDGSDPANGNSEPDEQPTTDEVPFWSYRVINEFPHDAAAFTQGFVYVDGRFLEGTGGGRRASTFNTPTDLRWVDIETGQVLQRVIIDDEYFGEGVTMLDGRIYQLTWRSRVGFVWDENLTQIRQFNYAETDTTGWGLTHDGEHLWMSDGSSWLSQRDPETFAEIRRIQAWHEDNPVSRLNELEYVDGEIWANVYRTDIVARIRPADGAVVGWIDLRGLLTQEERSQTDVLNGIAWDAATGRIFVTGKFWPKVFEIELLAR